MRNGWQPIETGPKIGHGGPLCLLFDPRKGIFVGRWVHNEWMSVPGDYGRKPSHWMPMPDLPVSQ